MPLRGERSRYGPRHATVLDAQLVLSVLLQALARYEEQVTLCTEVLEAGAEERHWLFAKLGRAMACSELSDFELAQAAC